MSRQLKTKQKTNIPKETKTIFMVFMDDPSCMLTRMPADNLQMIPSPHSSVRDSEKKSEANKFFFQLLWFSKRETEKNMQIKRKKEKSKCNFSAFKKVLCFRKKSHVLVLMYVLEEILICS